MTNVVLLLYTSESQYDYSVGVGPKGPFYGFGDELASYNFSS